MASIALNMTVSFTVDYVHVQGSARYPYLITTVNDVPVSCSCPDFTYRGDRKNFCKHMRDVAAGVANIVPAPVPANKE